MYNRLIINTLGFMAFRLISKHLLRLTQSNILTLALVGALSLRVWAE